MDRTGGDSENFDGDLFHKTGRCRYRREPSRCWSGVRGAKGSSDLSSVPYATAMLMGLINGLNLSYPPGFRYTFKALQKLMATSYPIKCTEEHTTIWTLFLFLFFL